MELLLAGPRVVEPNRQADPQVIRTMTRTQKNATGDGLQANRPVPDRPHVPKVGQGPIPKED